MNVSDYIKREDVLSILNEARKEWKPEIGVGRGEYLRIRYKNLPAADVVEVVRCKDCKYCLEQNEHELWCYGPGFPASLTRANDYCSRGTDMRGEEPLEEDE